MTPDPEPRQSVADGDDEKVMVGQVYERVSGPELLCEVRILDGEQAMCAMSGEGRSYGVKPIPLDLLHTDELRLVRPFS